MADYQSTSINSEIIETVVGDPETIHKYVEEIVVDYGSYGEEADEKDTGGEKKKGMGGDGRKSIQTQNWTSLGM